MAFDLRRGRAIGRGLGILGALTLLGAGSQPLARVATRADDLSGGAVVSAHGAFVPGLTAGWMVAGAALLLSVLGPRSLRPLASLALVILGAGLFGAAFWRLVHPAPGLVQAWADQTLAATTASAIGRLHPELTPWFWAVVLGCVAVSASGALALLGSRAEPSPGAAGAEPADVEPPAQELWRALSRGEDPTA